MMNKVIAAAILATASAAPLTTPGGSVGTGTGLSVATFDSVNAGIPVVTLNTPYMGLLFSGITPINLPKLGGTGGSGGSGGLPIPLPTSGTGVGSFPIPAPGAPGLPGVPVIPAPGAPKVPTVPTLPTLPTLPSMGSTFPGSPSGSFDLKNLNFACAAASTIVGAGAATPCTLNIKGYTDDAKTKLAAAQTFVYNVVPTVGGSAGASTGNTVPMATATLSTAFSNLKQVTFEVISAAGKAVAAVGMLDGITYHLNPSVSGSIPLV